MTSKLGEKIKSLREEHKVGVRELGRLVDVSAMISNIEKGSSASAEIIQKIAEALKTDADELLALADQIAPDVANVINSNTQAVPSFLAQWNKLMKQVEKMSITCFLIQPSKISLVILLRKIASTEL